MDLGMIVVTYLLLLVAVKIGNVTVPSEWRSSVELVLTCLKYWEPEAPDLHPARMTLLKIVADVYGENLPGSHG